MSNYSEYRVDMFTGKDHITVFFDDIVKATIFGTKQALTGQYVGVFLLKHVLNGMYDVEATIDPKTV